jgi:hypothetical protein
MSHTRGWPRRWVFVGLVASFSAPAQDGGSLDFSEDAFVIEGKVQKPEVVVEIARKNLQKGFELELRESFLHKVVEALDEAPF